MKHLGSLDKLFFSATAGETAVTELKNIKDLSVSYEREEIDVSDRASGDWGSFLAGKRTCKISFTYFDMNDDKTKDENLEAILSAWHSNALVSMKAVTLSGRGVDADWSITSITDDQTNEGAGVYQISASVNTDIRTPVECKAESAGA